jgi:hypothetical protein
MGSHSSKPASGPASNLKATRSASTSLKRVAKSFPQSQSILGKAVEAPAVVVKDAVVDDDNGSKHEIDLSAGVAEQPRAGVFLEFAQLIILSHNQFLIPIDHDSHSPLPGSSALHFSCPTAAMSYLSFSSIGQAKHWAAGLMPLLKKRYISKLENRMPARLSTRNLWRDENKWCSLVRVFIASSPIS